MKHSYYENLIFSQGALTKSEQADLKNHLTGCIQCQKLYTGWHSLSPLLSEPGWASPKKDFSYRWASSIQSRIELQKKRFVKSIIWSLAGTAMLCLIVFVFVNLNAGSASAFFQRAAHFSRNTAVVENQVRNFLYIALYKMPPFVWIIILAAFLGWVSIGGVIWYFVAKKKKGIKVQHEIHL